MMLHHRSQKVPTRKGEMEVLYDTNVNTEETCDGMVNVEWPKVKIDAEESWY